MRPSVLSHPVWIMFCFTDINVGFRHPIGHKRFSLMYVSTFPVSVHLKGDQAEESCNMETILIYKEWLKCLDDWITEHKSKIFDCWIYWKRSRGLKSHQFASFFFYWLSCLAHYYCQNYCALHYFAMSVIAHCGNLWFCPSNFFFADKRFNLTTGLKLVRLKAW